MTELCSKSVNNIDWLKAEEPKIVRNEFKRIIEFVKEVSEETAVFIYDSPRKQQRSPDLFGRNLTPRHIASTSTFETGSLSSALEKMWTEKVEYNTVIDFKQEIILLAIVKIGLRSLVDKACTWIRRELPIIQKEFTAIERSDLAYPICAIEAVYKMNADGFKNVVLLGSLSG
uniref:Uncharacterized protein n=1 Tax=Panagrolaimus davidi TaxID=227884 RepID=A0A914QUU1_9BILA